MNIESYEPRPTRYLGLAEHGDWRIKLYSIAAVGGTAPEELVEQARDVTLPYLPEPAVTDERYGAGFLIVHRGSGANWLLLDWWESECILCHRLFRSTFESPDDITEVRDGHLMACTYEMTVQQYERQAWIETVMAHGVHDGMPDYLRRHLSMPCDPVFL